jgi:hypothetical protein
VEKAGKQYSTKHTTWNSETKENETKDAMNDSPFSFWNFIEPEDKEAYFADAHGKKPEGYEGWTKEEQFAFDLKFTGNGWYDWNIREWGTKWDAGSPNVEVHKGDYGNASAYITFETAWSVPEPVFRAMVEQHPTLDFDFECEEEQGWGVKFTSSDGDEGERSLIETESWDIPDSHADYVSRDREDSCSCAWSDDQEDWYDDCPRPEQDFYVVVTKTYKVRTNTAENAWELAQDNDPDEQMELQEDETQIFVTDGNGKRLFPTMNDGEPKVKVCEHKFVPLSKLVDGTTQQVGFSCVFCNEEKELDTETESV